MPIEFSDTEVLTVRNLLRDFGFEYGLVTKLEDAVALAKKLGMDDLVKVWES